ncbi:hypothetical protein F0562_002469 [Nyssa sinensis]|uniref:Uncharacterized protein n=1 Tax=Nyssa sinensis TaxID=561372 RepID=A0A5J5C5V0_9ASTE|nr:hypothetical protein F0562_002469 [Nyssa sinensis]
MGTAHLDHLFKTRSASDILTKGDGGIAILTSSALDGVALWGICWGEFSAQRKIELARSDFVFPETSSGLGFFGLCSAKCPPQMPNEHEERILALAFDLQNLRFPYLLPFCPLQFLDSSPSLPFPLSDIVVCAKREVVGFWNSNSHWKLGFFSRLQDYFFGFS